MAEELGQALEWDSVITDDAETEFELFDPGIYLFEVQSVERGQFNGSSRMEMSPMAKITLKAKHSDGRTATVYTNIILNKKLSWKIKSFFMACGLIDENIPKGAPWSADWSKAPGSTGYMKLKHRTYNDKTYMEVDKFLKPSEVSGQAVAQSVMSAYTPATAAPVAPQAAPQAAPTQVAPQVPQTVPVAAPQTAAAPVAATAPAAGVVPGSF